jgi:hypothetical protein
MSYVYQVTPDHPLCGSWVARNPDETSDYQRAEYTISVVDGQFQVTGVDCSDGEEFLIYDIGYDGEWIRFVSQMPSTGRSGRNWMRIVDKDKIEFRFTFTETEFWVRKPFAVKVLPPHNA